VNLDYLLEHNCHDLIHAYGWKRPQPAQAPIIRPRSHLVGHVVVPPLEPPLPLRFSDSDFSINMPAGSKYNPIVV
jgi:hypothetical protein